MAEKKGCPFCGSEKVIIDTPYLDKFGQKITSYCCNAQKKNHEYVRARFNWRAPFDEQMTAEDVSKL